MDALDKQIISHLAVCGPRRVAGLAEAVCADANKYALEKLASSLRYRLRRMVEHGLIAFDSAAREYSLTDHEYYVNCTVMLHGDEDVAVPVGPVVLFKLGDVDFLVMLDQP